VMVSWRGPRYARERRFIQGDALGDEVPTEGTINWILTNWV
ncbi:unnamed protein product, partial [Acidithrix sp. C25]